MTPKTPRLPSLLAGMPLIAALWSACPAPAAPAAAGKFLGCIWKSGWLTDTACGPRFTALFDQVTPEGAGKWGAAEPQRGTFVWGPLDAMHKFASAHGTLVKQHNFVWGQAQPDWIGNYRDADTVKALVAAWMGAYFKRYPGPGELVDVVNEPLHAAAPYADYLGGGGKTGWDWVVWCYRTARSLAPGDKLLLNDYDILKDDGATGRYLEIVKILQAEGLIDGIGEQCHNLEGCDTATVHRNLDRLAATGLPVYISELDLNIADDNAQLKEYQRLFPLLWNHPSVKGVTLWGYQQGSMWRADAYLVRKDGTERPALTWLRGFLGRNATALAPARPAKAPSRPGPRYGLRGERVRGKAPGPAWSAPAPTR